MRKLLLIAVGFALALAPSLAFATVTARTIVNPASNSPLSSAVMRNELQLLENEITNIANGIGWTNANTAGGTALIPPANGGVGIANTPSYGQLLVGNAGGTYTLTATSSLGITASAAWGTITGTLSNQTDLQNALNAKVGLSSFSAGYPLSYNSGTGAFSIVATSSYGCTVSCFASHNISQWTNDSGYLTSETDPLSLHLTDWYATSSAPQLTTLVNLATVGTISSGVWHGTPIADTYISSSGNWNTAYTDRITGANYPLSITSNVLSVVATSSDNCTVTCFLSHNVSQWTNDAGYLTANQSITLSGAVSGSGTTAITTSYAGTLGNSLGGTGQNSSSWNGLAAMNAGVWTDLSTTSLNASITGNAGSATKLATGRTIAITGDLAYTSPSFDGSGNVTAAGTLATVNSNVGSYTNANITVNGKGLITAASNGSGGSGTGLATSSPVSGGNLLEYSASGAGSAFGVATSTLTGGGPITVSNSPVIIGSSGAVLGCSTCNTTNATVSSIGSASGITGGTITTTGTLSLVNWLATSTNDTSSDIPYYTTTNGWPAKFGEVATSTLTASSPLTGSFTVVGTTGSVGCQTASGSQAGCIASADWTTFNNKISWGAATSTSVNQFVYTNGNNLFISAASSSLDLPSSALQNTAVTAGSYTNTNLTVNAEGQITAASNGSGGSGTGLSTSSPIASSNLLEYSASGAGSAFGVATSTLTGGGPITVSNSPVIIGSSGAVLGCSTCNTSNASVSSVATDGTLTGGTITTTGTLGLNLASINTWTGKQTFGYASSTAFSASGTIFADNFYDTSAAGSSCIGDSSGILENGNCVASLASSGSTITVSSPTGNVNVDLNLSHANSWSALQTFIEASTTNVSASGEGYFGTASTTSLTVSGIQSALIKTSSTGVASAYGGASACSSSNFVTTISALGATTCGTAAISGVNLGSNLNSLSVGSSLTGTSYNGSSAVSNWGINLSNANTWAASQMFLASTTVGAGAAATGLTVSGAATTTKNIIIQGTATSTFAGQLLLNSALGLYDNGGTSTIQDTNGTNITNGSHGINVIPGASTTTIQFY